MKALVREKERAIMLRKKGYSYKEILLEVKVAKSSLSLWLKDLPLTKSEKQVLKKRADSNITLGRIRAAAANRQNRLVRDKKSLENAKQEFQKFKNNPLFQVGIALYWAEGAKRDTSFHFINSDHEMINMMILWLESFTHYKRPDLGFRLFIHQPFIRDNCEMWWQEQLGLENKQFKKTVIKPSGVGVRKRPNYRGCIRLEVPRSGHLLFKIKYWTNLMVEYHRNR